MVNFKIQDLIKRGIIQHCVGDEVIVFHRKSNGYPRALKDDVIYYVKQILPDGHIILTTGVSKEFPSREIKVHEKYIISRSKLRDFKLNSILGQTN